MLFIFPDLTIRVINVQRHYQRNVIKILTYCWAVNLTALIEKIGLSIYASFLFRLQAPTGTGREQGTDNSSSSQGLIAGLIASILAVVIIIGFFAYRRGYLK